MPADYRGSPLLINAVSGVKNQKVALYNLWLERDTAASWNKVCGALAQEGKKVLAAHLKATRVARKPVAIKQTSEGVVILTLTIDVVSILYCVHITTLLE